MRALGYDEIYTIFKGIQDIIRDNPRLEGPLRSAASYFQNGGTVLSGEDIDAFDRNMVECLKGDHAVFLSPDASVRIRSVFNNVHTMLEDDMSIATYEESLLGDDFITKNGTTFLAKRLLSDRSKGFDSAISKMSGS